MYAFEGCIYAIERGERAYVGSTAYELSIRIEDHLSRLRLGKHYSPKLQADFNEHGESAFAHRVLEAVPRGGDLVAREQHWIKRLRACERGYNTLPAAASRRKTQTQKASDWAQWVWNESIKNAISETEAELGHAVAYTWQEMEALGYIGPKPKRPGRPRTRPVKPPKRPLSAIEQRRRERRKWHRENRVS